MVGKNMGFRELHLSDDLRSEEKKIQKQLKEEASKAQRRRLEGRLERVHGLQEKMKRGQIADAYVSVITKEDFDAVDFIEKFSKEHKSDSKKKNSGLRNFLKGLGLSAALLTAGFMSKGDNEKNVHPEHDKTAVVTNTVDAIADTAKDFVEVDDNNGIAATDAHARWRGEFMQARDSGKIDDANDLSAREGWHIPIEKNSVLWSVFSMNTPEYQKAYNSLNKVSRTYYNGYLDMIARGLENIAQIESPTSAHKNTADVNALFEATYLNHMDALLATDFTKDAKGNISQEAHNTLVDYQLFQMASEQVLGSALSIYLMPEYGYDSIKNLQTAVDQLKDVNSGKKLLSALNPQNKNTRTAPNRRGPIGGHGR